MNDREEISEYNKAYYKYEEMMKEFPLLYRQRKLPMTQTCMCWGIDCGEGWYLPLHELSQCLEAINVAVGKKWGFRIEAEQVKQKYGTLRFYWAVRPVAPWWRNAISYPFRWLCQNAYSLDAKGAELVVGRFLYNTFFHIGQFLQWASPKHKQRDAIIQGVDHLVSALVSKCDAECFNVCEDCGRVIGKPYSPRYTTLGWVSYLCDKCAEKTEGYYTISDEEENFHEFEEKAKKRRESLYGKIYRKGKDVTAEYHKMCKERNKKRYEEEKEAEKKAKEKPSSATPRKKTTKKTTKKVKKA